MSTNPRWLDFLVAFGYVVSFAALVITVSLLFSVLFGGHCG